MHVPPLRQGLVEQGFEAFEVRRIKIIIKNKKLECFS
jgi:hypothetical protein